MTTKGVSIANVTFKRGCRNHWHRHISGDGGYYQKWSEPAGELLSGNIVEIGEEKHWHGAAPDSCFCHIAIEISGENAKTQ